MVRCHRGENLLKRLETGFHKLLCISRTHCQESKAKHEPDQRPRGHLVLHDQHNTILANHPFHFIKRFGTILSFKFVERMGTAYRLEQIIDKRQAGSVSLNKSDAAG